jgi:uncharacterized integral membrane protein
MQEYNAGKFSRHEQAESGARGPSPALIAFLVVLALAVIFVTTNRNKVEVQLLFWSPQARVWTALLIAVIIGVILDRVFQVWWRRRRRSAKGE